MIPKRRRSWLGRRFLVWLEVLVEMQMGRRDSSVGSRFGGWRGKGGRESGGCKREIYVTFWNYSGRSLSDSDAYVYECSYES